MKTHDENIPEGRQPAPRPANDDVRHLQALLATKQGQPSTVLHLQRAAGNDAAAQLLAEDENNDRSPVLDEIEREGQPLDPQTQATMEQNLGADFSDVRVHTDAEASASAKSVQAHAYTVGSDVVFQSGSYQPDTESGQRTLAHELTHVMQQRSGPVDGSDAGGGIAVSDPSDRFEQAAESNADRFVAGKAADTQPVAQGLSVQRDAIGEEDSDELGGAGVQRQEEEVEEEEMPG
jgi:hypothetical protein